MGAQRPPTWKFSMKRCWAKYRKRVFLGRWFRTSHPIFESDLNGGLKIWKKTGQTWFGFKSWANCRNRVILGIRDLRKPYFDTLLNFWNRRVNFFYFFFFFKFWAPKFEFDERSKTIFGISDLRRLLFRYSTRYFSTWKFIVGGLPESPIKGRKHFFRRNYAQPWNIRHGSCRLSIRLCVLKITLEGEGLISLNIQYILYRVCQEMPPYYFWSWKCSFFPFQKMAGTYH